MPVPRTLSPPDEPRDATSLAEACKLRGPRRQEWLSLLGRGNRSVIFWLFFGKWGGLCFEGHGFERTCGNGEDAFNGSWGKGRGEAATIEEMPHEVSAELEHRRSCAVVPCRAVRCTLEQPPEFAGRPSSHQPQLIGQVKSCPPGLPVLCSSFLPYPCQPSGSRTGEPASKSPSNFYYY